MLGTQDLGQVYFEPIKDKHGNALLVLLKDMSSCPNLDGVRWMQLCKLQLQRKSISSPEEPTSLDMLLITLHVSPTENLRVVCLFLFKTECLLSSKEYLEGSLLCFLFKYTHPLLVFSCYTEMLHMRGRSDTKQKVY